MHAKIKVLQEQYGLSYKDAAHWLYLAEYESLWKAKEMQREITALRCEADKLVVRDIMRVIEEIDDDVKRTQ